MDPQHSSSSSPSEPMGAEPESTTGTEIPSQSDSSPRVSRKVVAGVGVGLALLVLLVARPFSGSGGVPELPFADSSIRNGEEVLKQAVAALEIEAAIAGADLSDSGCWISQMVDSEGNPYTSELPTVLCGPVLFRPSSEPWVTGSIVLEDWDKGVARFGEFTSTTALPLSGYKFFGKSRPDADAVPKPPTPPDSVLDVGNRLALVGVDKLLADAEAELKDVLDTSTKKYSLQDDASCWVVLSGEPPVVCGPVLFADSLSEDEAFVGFQVRFDKTNFWSASVALEPGSMSTRTIRLPDQVVRPDGVRPPAIGVTYPDPDPIPSASMVRLDDSLIVLDAPTGKNHIQLPWTESTIRLVGHEIVERVGTGPNAVIAAPGETLAIVRFESSAERETLKTVNAVLSIGGSRSAQSTEILQGGMYAFSIPKDPKQPALLEVTDEVAFPQFFNLRTGQRNEDGPSSLYRRNRRVDIGRNVQQQVDIRPYTYVQWSGVVQRAEIGATTPGAFDTMLPKESARLTVTVEYRYDDRGSIDSWESLASSMRAIIDEKTEVVAAAKSRDGNTIQFHFVVPANMRTAKLFFLLSIDYELYSPDVLGKATAQGPEQEIFTADFGDPLPQ